MREIKFRAWDVAEGCWIPESEFFIAADGTFFTRNSHDSEGRGISEEVIEVKLMQFTGLHDKNGKEIWEGDIIHRQNGHDWVVEWSDKLLAMAIRRIKRKTHPYLDEVYATVGDILKWDGVMPEVLGNIYENPDLLKDQA